MYSGASLYVHTCLSVTLSLLSTHPLSIVWYSQIGEREVKLHLEILHPLTLSFYGYVGKVCSMCGTLRKRSSRVMNWREIETSVR
ncbi:hypothetical protein QBC33DRAFT_528300 [Phialemonium atrogriseum]|uniref:Uncharacterized protein n=1 Tax=Phialemonium atrogriseum TaxID=1093897 RepID=A0AAJ0FJD3_9PEZI|nr:uncharacterized protein QBC33DRAFT_528300 [Phialemonium atrogriseum]KAK1770516.1 hypothetical protein QBC33DRAFT_528300 [Phialemonium atrogriseum]